MSSIVFDDQRPVSQMKPGRADVACFVGLVRLVGGVPLAVLPDAVAAWFVQQGWLQGPFQRPLADQLSLLDLPVPVESFAGFTTLFDPGDSELSSGTDYLAAAVRSFFAQGGNRCYVVRLGDPIAPGGSPSALLSLLLPPLLFAADDPRGWHSYGHLAGLPDVTFLCMPDLPVLSASAPPAISYQPAVPPSGPEQFVECSVASLVPPGLRTYSAPAPRLTLDDYARWAAGLKTVLAYLAANAREVQMVAAMPLPQVYDVVTAAAVASGTSADALASSIHDVIDAQMSELLSTDPSGAAAMNSLSTAFLQLGYPWLKTTGSFTLLESLEPPDGVLVGLLARNALTRGTFVSAILTQPSEVYDLWPPLPSQDVHVSTTPLVWRNNLAESPVPDKPLIERLSLFGFTPGGLQLLSDVTAYPGETYRSAAVNRLVSVISRAARRLGETVVFADNGPNLWARVENFLSQLLTALWRLDALDGATAKDAFSVNCDSSTMTQNDIDNGRVIAVVTFMAASTIELIRVTLALEPSGAAGQNASLLLTEVA
jgi:Bacteriophage tail sheath protein